jgi:hypothetical protein
MNEVSPGNVPAHTQLAIRLFHPIEYMENKKLLPLYPCVSNHFSFYDLRGQVI